MQTNGDNIMTEYDTFKDGIGITTLASERGSVDNIREDSPVTLSGVALPENVVLMGGRDEEHFFTPQMAERAAEVLQRQIEDEDTIVHLVKNFHDTEGAAGADDIIGEVTSAGYQKGVGVVFEAETTDVETAQKIDLGYLQVSPSVARELGAFNETMQAREVNEVAGFRDIAVVGNGQPGVDVEVGPNPGIEALSREITVDAYESDNEPEESETMSVDKAKETIANEYDVEVDELESKLTEEPEETPENVVKLVEQ